MDEINLYNAFHKEGSSVKVDTVLCTIKWGESKLLRTMKWVVQLIPINMRDINFNEKMISLYKNFRHYLGVHMCDTRTAGRNFAVLQKCIYALTNDMDLKLLKKCNLLKRKRLSNVLNRKLFAGHAVFEEANTLLRTLSYNEINACMDDGRIS